MIFYRKTFLPYHATVKIPKLTRNINIFLGMTPLLVAAYEGHHDVCELLLEGDADVDHTDKNSRSPLQAAASMGHSAVVNLLLFWGAAVDTIDTEGRTVLSIASTQGNVDVVRQLLERGLDEMHRDNSGMTPLHLAACEGHKEVGDPLLSPYKRQSHDFDTLPENISALASPTPVDLCPFNLLKKYCHRL